MEENVSLFIKYSDIFANKRISYVGFNRNNFTELHNVSFIHALKLNVKTHYYSCARKGELIRNLSAPAYIHALHKFH